MLEVLFVEMGLSGEGRSPSAFDGALDAHCAAVAPDESEFERMREGGDAAPMVAVEGDDLE